MANAIYQGRMASMIEDGQQQRQLVLVVEDHATNRKVLMRQLTALGYAAESASNGLEALDMLKTGRYALLICDCQMPAMGGYKLTRTIRAQELALQQAPLPIVAFSVNAYAVDEVRTRLAGMGDYLCKPASMGALGAMLRRQLPQPPDHGTPDVPPTPPAPTPGQRHNPFATVAPPERRSVP